MTDNIFAGKTKDEAKISITIAGIVIMVMEFICTFGVYALLKTYISCFWAECWIIFSYAFILKQYFDLALPKVIKALLEKYYGHESIQTEENLEKDNNNTDCPKD